MAKLGFKLNLFQFCTIISKLVLTSYIKLVYNNRHVKRVTQYILGE